MNMMPLKQEPDHHEKPVLFPPDSDGTLYREERFNAMLSLERKRTERSGKHLRLMRLDIEGISGRIAKKRIEQKLAQTLSAATRETDIKGWYKQDSVLGVIFTETNGTDPVVLQRKIEGGLFPALSHEERERINVTYHVFPDDQGFRQGVDATDLTLYPDLPERERSRRAALFIKRLMDIAGSIAGILLFLPVFLLASIFIKLTSRGPVLFRQERIGQYGRTFTFLKFRSMYVDNDESVHRQYVQKLIAGAVDGRDGGSGEQKVFKITADKRVTPIGNILRKTSMDELPQFINVLRGEMSLVGPRPPIPYEVERYDVWHRRRIMEIKPGITGLWQVKGRSATTFDDMVRLDLQYARDWSIWVDIKILLKTPGAVLRGRGAY